MHWVLGKCEQKGTQRWFFFVFRPETRVCFFKIPFSEGWYIQNIAICNKNTAWLNRNIRSYPILLGCNSEHDDWWPKNYGSCSTSSLYWINQRSIGKLDGFPVMFSLEMVCGNLSFLGIRDFLMGFQGSCLRSPLEGCTPNLNIAIDYAIDNFIHHPQCFFVGCFIEMGNLWNFRASLPCSHSILRTSARVVRLLRPQLGIGYVDQWPKNPRR